MHMQTAKLACQLRVQAYNLHVLQGCHVYPMLTVCTAAAVLFQSQRQEVPLARRGGEGARDRGSPGEEGEEAKREAAGAARRRAHASGSHAGNEAGRAGESEGQCCSSRWESASGSGPGSQPDQVREGSQQAQ